MEPCVECIGRVMCINKRWQDIVDACDLLCQYLCDSASLKESVTPPFASMVRVKSLDKTFSVTISRNENDLFAIGEYWKPTVNKKTGYTEKEYPYDEVRLVTQEELKAAPTMLMKTYKRKKDATNSSTKK
jgi:hypothetical protein